MASVRFQFPHFCALLSDSPSFCYCIAGFSWWDVLIPELFCICRVTMAELYPNLVSGMLRILLRLKGSRWFSTRQEIIRRMEEEQLQRQWFRRKPKTKNMKLQRRITSTSFQERYFFFFSVMFFHALCFTVTHHTFSNHFSFLFLAESMELLRFLAFFVLLKEQNSAASGWLPSLVQRILWCCGYANFLCIYLAIWVSYFWKNIWWDFLSVHYIRLLVGLPSSCIWNILY